MTKIIDTKNIFDDTEIIEAIKNLKANNMIATISSIFTKINIDNKYSFLHDEYLELAEKLIIMKSQGLLTWGSESPNTLKTFQGVELVDEQRGNLVQ